MNILLISSDHSKNNYGVTSVVSQLVDQLSASEESYKVFLLTTGSNSVPQKSKVQVVELPVSKLGSFWRWSPQLVKKVDTLIEKENIDLIHIHAIWHAVQWAGLIVARKKKIPVVISVHGMLEKWFWNGDNYLKQLKKKVYISSVLRPALSSRTCFHAITPEEEVNIKHFFPKNLTKIIPNAIHFPKTNEFQSNPIIPEYKIVFLGRLHPIKGVDILLHAFGSISQEYDNWHLEIVGPSEDEIYAQHLKNLVSDYRLNGKVDFLGYVAGEAKRKLLERAWVVVAPSYSEVVGMVNLEAALHRTPSITTYETGLLSWEESGGLLIHPEVDPLTQALKKIMQWDIETRISKGEQAHKFVKENFSWEKVLPMWRNFYSSLIYINDERS